MNYISKLFKPLYALYRNTVRRIEIAFHEYKDCNDVPIYVGDTVALPSGTIGTVSELYREGKRHYAVIQINNRLLGGHSIFGVTYHPFILTKYTPQPYFVYTSYLNRWAH
jgi:hypothetical protein